MTGTRKRKDKNHHHHHQNVVNNKPRHRIPSSNGQKLPAGSDAKSDGSNNPTDDSDKSWLFPWWTPQFVWLLCTAGRVKYVQNPDNWWILHPDETFQSMEVAHTQVYGYGFRPYEYSSLSHGTLGGAASDVSLYRQRELELGMHGMRSALYPCFYVVVSFVADVFGLDVRPFVLWKVAHAVVSSLLPLSVYRFARVYFRSHDAACLAAILVAMSTHLNVLGTHPLLNTFLSPFVFWALSCVHPLIHGQRRACTLSESHMHADRRRGSGQTGNAVNRRTFTGALSDEFEYTGGTTLTSSRFTGEVDTPRNPSQVLNGTARQTNGTVVHGCPRTPSAVRDNARQDYTSESTCMNGTPAGYLDRRAMTTHRSDTIQAFLVNFFSALVLALCVYIRMDVMLFSAVTLLSRFRPRLADYRALLASAAGAFAGLGFGVLEDFFFYDELVVSPSNWAMFNIFRDLAGDLFGKSSFSKYLVILFGNNFGLPVLAAFSVIVMVVVVVRGVTHRSFSNTHISSNNSGSSSNAINSNSNNTYADNHHPHNGKNRNQNDAENSSAIKNIDHSEPAVSFAGVHRIASWNTSTEVGATLTLTFSWVALLAFYSFREHKELRFVHNTIVLMLISFASVFSVAVEELGKKLSSGRVKLVIFALLALLAADQWGSFPSSRDLSNKSWAYQGIWDSHDISACLSYVSARNDVTGVFVDSYFHVTGGYSLLHRDVPLFTLLVHEFVEFESSGRITLAKPSLLDGSKNVSYVTIDRLSNLVSVQNAGYMVKLLIQKKQYNYLVMSRHRKFLAIGFREVFAQGTMRVMKRTFDPEQERQLETMAARAPMGVNATVLKYEGDVLFRFHRFHLALERYQAAFQLGPAHAQLFQAIGACKLKLGDQSGARSWIEACAERFGRSECSKALSITNINPDRHLF